MPHQDKRILAELGQLQEPIERIEVIPDAIVELRPGGTMSKSVLVVDDDPAVREILTLALLDEGYRVVAARDGVEALEQVGVQVPALILLDINMPRLDGVAFARELQRRGLRSAIPIMVVTAGGRAKWACDQIEAEGCLVKPFELDHLLEQVAHLAT